MNRFSLRQCAGGALLVASLCCMAPVNAGMLTLTCDLTGNAATSHGCPAAAPSYSVPGGYSFNRQFSARDGSTAIAGSNIFAGPQNTHLYGSSSGFIGAAGFIDDYFFQITDARADAVSATISLSDAFSIGKLFARIYQLGQNPSGLVTTTPVGPVTYGTVSQSTTPQGTATLVSVDPGELAAGSYVLEISGISDGTVGGIYTGSLQLTAVPVPAAIVLLLPGLGLVAGLRRRREHTNI